MHKNSDIDKMSFGGRLIYAIIVLLWGGYICAGAFGFREIGEIYIPLWLVKFIGISLLVIGVIIILPIKRRGPFFLLAICTMICAAFLGIAVWGTGECSITLLGTSSHYADLPCRITFFLGGLLMVPFIMFLIRRSKP